MGKFIIIAGGPYLTPSFLLFLMAGFTFSVLGVGLFVFSLVLLGRKRFSAGVAGLILGPLYLFPLVGSFHDDIQILIYYAVVSMIALIALAFFATGSR
jgi:hypothetical protein